MNKFKAKKIEKSSQYLQLQLDMLKHQKVENPHILHDDPKKSSIFQKIFSPFFNT